ncbi:MAG: lysylphosphatidylglycerol synthase transmembrane domain-containing protein [Elusimicrobia bacterium]|nr:lysylphosphatidylglycerol synthase transmembrane domain-containing protein [Elusimicrobiota bacterium]
MTRRLVIAGGFLASLGLLAYLIGGRLTALLRIGTQLDWSYVAAAVLCALASYFMVGLVLRQVLALLGHSLPFPVVLGIALVSTSVNYFVSTAGVSGFALKAHLLRKRQVPYATTVMAAVVSSAILYFVLAGILGQGLIYLFMHLQGARIAIMEGIVGLGLLLGTAIVLMVFVFNHKLRGRVMRSAFHRLNRVVFSFSKRDIPREEFVEFEHQLAAGLGTIHHHKGRLTKAIAFTGLDWVLAMLTLHFCLCAVGMVHMPVGHLVAGFSAGQATTLIPGLPGGLGAMEGSVAATFSGLGLDWDDALMAVLLYRVAYYLIPGILSVFVLWGLKMSEPDLMAQTALDTETLPEELKRKARELEHSQPWPHAHRQGRD